MYYIVISIIVLFILYYIIVHSNINDNVYIDIYIKNTNLNDSNILKKLSSVLLNTNLINYNSSKIIPNNLFQIYMFYKAPIPQYIFDGIKKYASNYNYYLLDDKDAENFLTKYFTNDVVNKFKNIRHGAHKADLLRYCLLYIYGGIYLDIKTILIKPLDDIFINKTYFYTCITKYSNENKFRNRTYQGIIASPPNNLIFLKLIYFITYIPQTYLDIYYHIVIKHLYYEIINDKKDEKMNPNISLGLNKGKINNYYIFEESVDSGDTCNIPDRYGVCVSILDNKDRIFIGRDPTFPWK